MDGRRPVNQCLSLTAAALLAMGAAGCSSSAIPLAAREPFMLAPREIEPPDAASRILSGFDLAARPDDWNIGDRVLLSIEQSKADGTTLHRLLLIELLGEREGRVMKYSSTGPGGTPYTLETPYVRTRLTLYDAADGRELTTALGRFPEAMLSSGLYDGAEPAVGLPPGGDALAGLSPDRFDRAMRGWLTTLAFSGSLGRRGLLQSMMKDVVARPSLLRLVFNPTATLETGDQGVTAGEPWSPPGASELRTVRVPLVLKIAGKPGLLGEVLAAEPAAPLSLCGGIVMAEARNADRPEARVQIKLLAARRGAGGRTFAPAKGLETSAGD